LAYDEDFHIQNFEADGPPVPEILKMTEHHVCRSTLMGLALSVAHDPLIDGDFAPVYYTQTDGQVMYVIERHRLACIWASSSIGRNSSVRTCCRKVLQ